MLDPTSRARQRKSRQRRRLGRVLKVEVDEFALVGALQRAGDRRNRPKLERIWEAYASLLRHFEIMERPRIARLGGFALAEICGLSSSRQTIEKIFVEYLVIQFGPSAGHDLPRACRSCKLANAQLTLEPFLNMLSAKSGKFSRQLKRISVLMDSVVRIRPRQPPSRLGVTADWGGRLPAATTGRTPI